MVSELVTELRKKLQPARTPLDEIRAVYGQVESDEDRQAVLDIALQVGRRESSTPDQMREYLMAGGGISYEEAGDEAQAIEKDLPAMSRPQPTAGPLMEQLAALDQVWQSGEWWNGKQLTRALYVKEQGRIMGEIEAAQEHDKKALEAYENGDHEAYTKLVLERDDRQVPDEQRMIVPGSDVKLERKGGDELGVRYEEREAMRTRQ